MRNYVHTAFSNISISNDLRNAVKECENFLNENLLNNTKSIINDIFLSNIKFLGKKVRIII